MGHVILPQVCAHCSRSQNNTHLPQVRTPAILKHKRSHGFCGSSALSQMIMQIKDVSLATIDNSQASSLLLLFTHCSLHPLAHAQIPPTPPLIDLATTLISRCRCHYHHRLGPVYLNLTTRIPRSPCERTCESSRCTYECVANAISGNVCYNSKAVSAAPNVDDLA